MDTTIIGNPDPFPGAHGGTRDECGAWLEKDAAIRAKGNPAPFPAHRDVAAQTAWHSKDMELRREAKTGKPPATPPKVNGAATAESDAELADDTLALPMDVAFLKKTLAAIGPEQRETFLMKLLVSSRDDGLPASVIIVAQEEFYGAQILDLMRENGKLFEEIRSLKLAQNHAEKEVLDELADNLLSFTKNLIVSETKRRVAQLQERVLAKSRQITNEKDTLEQLSARATLLDGRIRSLELTNPIWVAVNSQG